MGQGNEDHLVTQEADIPEVNRVQWRKIDAQLCSVLWQSVDPKILLHLRAYKTCFKFWNQAKGLYMNDIQRLYKVASSMVNVRQQDMDLSTYIGQIASLKEEFLTVMPLTTDVGDQRTQIDKFFMVLTLIGLRPDLETVRDQILGSSSVPSLDDVFARLLLVTEVEANVLIAPIAISLATLVIGGISLTDSEYDDYLRYQATKSASVASVAQTSNASACLTHTSSLGPWILDSSASNHIFGNKDFFSSITTTSALPTVTLANGSQTMAKGFGFTHPLPSLPLHSILYAPACPFNLISISKITRTLNCSITFSDKFVTLQDRSTGKTIGIGHESQGLYHLTSPSTPAVCVSTDAPLLIHSRLGHPSQSKFQKMVPSFSSLSSLACESCQLGKHTRVSFPKRLNNRAKSPFKLVHTDVWSPCRTASTLRFYDNVREYFSAPFTSFMSQHGIIHQSSCAHTPQQNGIAEPCYLINRMPSSVLYDQIPRSLLFPDQPLYFLPPRVFGCTCFVHILTPGQDKLSTRATKCIFLGYSKLQKGYRCYSFETHRYFLSADVTFFEDSPFFSTSESLPVSEVLPLPIISPPDAVPSRPLQVYHRRHHVAVPPSLAKAPADSLPIPSASPAPALPPSADLPIALRKVKVGPDGQVVCLKARLVAKGYTQVYGSNCGDTFSPVAKIASVRLLLSIAAMRSWPLYQLDIKNAFLHGDLAEEVYMEQPPGFVAQGESSLVYSTVDHSVFYHHNSSGQYIYLVVYVDDIVITGSDQNGIQKLKQHLFTHFQNKDLGKLKYFLRIEIAQSSSDVVLSQRKYALDIWEETGMLDCKPVDTPMDSNVKLIPGQGEPLGDLGRYRRLVGKLNYLTITRLDISFPVSVVSQFLQSPCDSHWDAVIRILRYIKSTPGQGVLYENRGHTQVVGYTDADWAGSPTDRHSTSGSSAEAECQAMALATCELIWLKHLLRELRFGKDEQMKLICDNQAALHIASNPVFHERTKHIEVDCHFIREKIASGCVATNFVKSNDQLADIFTKSLRGPRIKYICNKLGAYNIYAPA
ncbi:Retrovirus-related Pol polyprotein from transposon RE2 [Vitis vinifera]|uniref:Retrovirus-related Pol polyprotein from transposon RE2 n=1 Tax=Vitis vinifera TaxID=29760 RepID=A0A438I5V5_VITVI|nr:Retrovirus-related Pol polyprotein from transposon RE2 [Vitis vinifera]